MYSILLYTTGILLIVLFVVLFYIKCKYRFWSCQPVFHVYDMHYYLFPPGIIEHGQPEKNKYCNFANIDTYFFEKLSDIQINRFTRFIQKHFLQNKDNVFLPKKQNILPYFYGHNSPCFLSFYSEDDVLLDTKTQTPIPAPKHKVVSVITTHPLHCTINNKNNINNCAIFDVYYVDYLCVDPQYRKKGIAPQIIQTHHYNQRLYNKNIVVSLFKREGTLTGIVPLCVYNTYGFHIPQHYPNALPNDIALIEVGTQNLQYLTDFIQEQKSNFDIIIMPEFANIVECIKTKNIFVYILIQDHVVFGAYFFKKTCTYIEKGKEAVSCFCSIYETPKKNQSYFIDGYKNALVHLVRKYPRFQYSVIEGVSHNDIIIKNLLSRSEPMIVSPTAYFFYNFAYPTFLPTKCLIIN